MFQKVHLDYDLAPILNADYSQHTGSCIGYQVHELTDIHSRYGGFPKTYITENTIIHQLWWTEDQLDFKDIGRQLNMEVITISSICQPPGNIITWHRDTFYQIKKRFPEDTRTHVRANIHLEDVKMGHFLQYENDNTLFTHVDWKAGDGLMWDSSVEHLGCNAGFENKYTLQISGFWLGE